MSSFLRKQFCPRLNYYAPSWRASSHYQTVSCQTAMPSPTFLTLPTEVRHMIYSYAISSCPTTLYQEPLDCPIVLACRQTYQEAEELYYSKFYVRVRINRDGLMWYQTKSDQSWRLVKNFCSENHPAILRS